MESSIFEVSESWRKRYPEAFVGILVLTGVSNPTQHSELDKLKAELENKLREKYHEFERKDFESLPVMQAYIKYYKQFEKTYHILLQLESVVKKGKSIPRVAALVESMFMAELEDMLLTAGHDFDLIQKPIKIDIAKGDEIYLLMRGQEQMLKAGDMYIADQKGIISNILYGPDQRTQIRESTKNVIFTVYAPPGITKESVMNHLRNIRHYTHIISPDAHTEMIEIFGKTEN